MTDFVDLLYRGLPGIYRQKDEGLELRKFIEIVAGPLSETEASIAQLYEDLFASSSRLELLPLIAGLIGAQLDPSLPGAQQRAALEEAITSFRENGLAAPLARTAEATSGWATTTVDFSQVVARLAHVEDTNPVLRRRARPVGQFAGGAGRFGFDPDGAMVWLHDESRGRPITRQALAERPDQLVGTAIGFTIRISGEPVIGPGAREPRPVVAANLTDFAAPLTPAGAPLVPTGRQIAVDPELGRFLVANEIPLAGNLAVDFHQLVPASIRAQTFDLRDGTRMERLGRSDDPAPYTLDLRSAQRASDRIGRTHFDNHGFYLTPSRRVVNQQPNHVFTGAGDGFTFDGRLLAPGDGAGHALQLLDGLAGRPITRRALAGHEHELLEAPRGFSVRVRGLPLAQVVSGSPLTLRTADLSDFAAPRDPDGGAVTLGPRDLAIDPQLGRFWLDLGVLGLSGDDVRVGYLLAPAARVVDATPVALAGGSTWGFAEGYTSLRDGFDGTTLASKLCLGGRLADLHGRDRGYRIRRDGADVSATLTPELRDLGTPSTPPAGVLAIDLLRGRFALPAGFLAAEQRLGVDFSASASEAENARFENLARQLERLMPAGVAPVIIDTRQTVVDPSILV